MKNQTPIFIWVILVVVFIASIRHIYEAWQKRDHKSIGEGVGTMFFSGMMIVLKYIG
jgi:hypothetical protein